jgi:hypothetical protein
MHSADWSTLVPGGVGKCHYPVSEARNTTWDHVIKIKIIKKIMKRRYYFHTDTRIKIVL